ncbi:MAG: hypothetical protein M3003_14085, partial [Candidatus Dormibacteraeota bacterium]|nr:hypothetical protein [Candidatus Dormibacteraeota bacterium]
MAIETAPKVPLTAPEHVLMEPDRGSRAALCEPAGVHESDPLLRRGPLKAGAMMGGVPQAISISGLVKT